MANETVYCERLKYNIYRKRPKHCMNYHAEETEIKLCGRASYAASCLSPLLLIVCVLLRHMFLAPSLSTAGRIGNNMNSKISLLWFHSKTCSNKNIKYSSDYIWSFLLKLERIWYGLLRQEPIIKSASITYVY